MKKKLRAQTPTFKNQVKKPECPRHKVPMEFYPDQMLWACPDELCGQVSFPHTDIDVRGKPQLLQGDLDVVMVEGQKTLMLRVRQYNVMLDISDVAEPVSVTYLSDGHLAEPIEVTLRINSATLIGENGSQDRLTVRGE